MLKNKTYAHPALIALATFALLSISLFTPFSTAIAQPAAPNQITESHETENSGPAGVQFGWEMNVAPNQVGNIQVLVDDAPIYNSNNPPSQNSVEFSYAPQTQHYSVIYYGQLQPGNHTWQVRVFNSENQVVSSTPPETFKVQDPSVSNQSIVYETVTDYRNFMNETKIGDMTVAEASQTSLLSLSAISAVFYGVVLLIQVSYILPMGIFAQILKALGLFKAGEEPRGFVFNSKTYEPIPFAVLTVTRVDENRSFSVDQNYHETIVSGTDGIYRGVNLPEGQYKLKVEKDGFTFPTKNKRAPFLSINDYYEGEVFTVSSTQASQQMLVPMDEIGFNEDHEGAASAEARKISLKHRRQNRWQVASKVIVKVLNKLMILFWIFSVMVLVASPEKWLNWVMFIVYTLIVGFDLIKVLRRPRLKGLVTDENAQPLTGTLIRLSTVDGNQLVGVASTDKKGRYEFFVKKGVYQLSAYHSGRMLKKDSPFTLTEVDLTKKRLVNDLVMEPVGKNLSDYFSQKVEIVDENNEGEKAATQPEPEIKFDTTPTTDQLPDFNQSYSEADGVEPELKNSAASEATKKTLPSDSSSKDEIPSFDTAALLKSQFGKK